MSRKGLRGRADLARALVTSDAADEQRLLRIALALGYERDELPLPETSVAAPLLPTPPLGELAIDQRPLVDVPFFYAARFTPRDVRGQQAAEPESPEPVAYQGWRERPTDLPPYPALAPWRILEPQLRACLAPAVASREIDAARAVERLAQAELLERFPTRERRRWARRLRVVLDRNLHLVPYWLDQEVVTAGLRRLLPNSDIQTLVLDAASGRFRSADDPDQPLVDPEAADEPLLVLGDLGLLGTRVAGDALMWRRLAERLGRGRAMVLSPADPALFPPDLRASWQIVGWDAAARGAVVPLAEQRSMAERLLRLVSPAVRVEPGLLRAVRRRVMPAAPASVEALAWRHPAMMHGSSVAGTMDLERRQALRAAFEREDAAIRRQVLELIRVWHAGLDAAVWLEEVLDLPEGSAGLVPAPDRDDARRYFQALRQRRRAGGGEALGRDVRAWLGRVGARTAAAWQDAAFREVVWSVKQHDPSFTPPVPPGKLPVEGAPVGSIALAQRGDRLALEAGLTTTGSLFGLLPSDDGLVELVADEGWRPIWGGDRPPGWVSDFGEDQYGKWLEFRVGDVVQRMRWIPPGSFLMGSPVSEEGRLDWEGPQREVTLADGFWLFATPVTQALYDAVTGRNPSRFKSPDRPVEQVTWHDAQSFLEQINATLPGLDLGLPSEAQWEYACRAGTTTAFSFGETVSRDHVHFDGDGTVPVGSLPPNPWGLFEMHGNVHEWCEDRWHWREGHDGAPTDGTARLDETPEVDTRRVLRGGSWAGGRGEYWTGKELPSGQKARYCRAASRGGASASGANGSIGFRCARRAIGHAESRRRASDARVTLGGGADRVHLPSGPFVLRTDLAELALARLTKADVGWAAGLGRDRFGLWADLVVEGVRQRLRWIPPGRFLMGAPGDEAGRWEDEGPRHAVTIGEGFWLFDTPVTQALWVAVTGDNPSAFKSPERPVEQVSFDDVRGFLGRVNEQVPGLGLVLPSEAMWEYACRAGTATAVWTGPLAILGERDAPGLDPIAWYGGNSGHGFELDDGYDSSDWPEKQYPHEKAGTRPVELKAANPWGLHDMLGNVWEWCADDWHDSYDGAPADGSAWLGPASKAGGRVRVIRGGSWSGHARIVRAAFRSRFHEGPRIDLLGFRCARGQG